MKIIKVDTCFSVTLGGREMRQCGPRSVRTDTGKIIPVRRVVWDYVCAQCEHGLVEYVDDVRCPECGSHTIIHRNAIREQVVDGVEVLNSLPVEFQTAVLDMRPGDVDTHATATALWGIGSVLPSPILTPLRQLPAHLTKK